MIITVLILLFAAVAFISGKIPIPVVSMLIIIALAATKVIAPSAALSGFSNSSVILTGAMFIVGGAIKKTSLLDSIKGLVLKYGNTPTKMILWSCIVSSMIGVIINSSAAVLILFPILATLPISRQKLYFPLTCAASVATAMTFMGSGAINLTINDILMQQGGSIPFTIWDFTLARLPFLIVIILYMCTVGHKLLPDTPNDQLEELNMSGSVAGKKLSESKNKLAIAIIAVTVLAMITYQVIGLDLFVIAMISCTVLILTGIMGVNEALGAIHLPTIFLFAGVLPLSSALSSTGAGDFIADHIVQMLGNTTNPYFIVGTFFVVPLILTQFMSNTACLTLFTPLAALVALRIGVDPRAAVMAAVCGAFGSFLTPMASPAEAICMSAGPYKVKDFMKCGLPLAVIMTVVAVIWLPIIMPL
ncbi:MAG: SLC13 family permease [Lachnospiraceae bacterium]|nr:SLC13 family permease [Lachnospiraceae bacterium]